MVAARVWRSSRKSGFLRGKPRQREWHSTQRASKRGLSTSARPRPCGLMEMPWPSRTIAGCSLDRLHLHSSVLCITWLHVGRWMAIGSVENGTSSRCGKEEFLAFPNCGGQVLTWRDSCLKTVCAGGGSKRQRHHFIGNWRRGCFEPHRPIRRDN